MVQAHYRQSVLIRWCRRCPECKCWCCLKLEKKQSDITGTHHNYVCRLCGFTIEDWSPSSAVKF